MQDNTDQYLDQFEFGLEKEYNALKSKENQEQADLRRMKTENCLLRQRIECLEKETSMLADRLIQDQVKHAHTHEEVYNLRRQMSYSRQQSQEQLICCPDQEEMNGLDGVDGSKHTARDTAKNARLAQLQYSLAEAHQREIKEKSIIQELRNKILELESVSSSEPSSEVQRLQEELIASKLREAESNMSAKELQQKVNELERHWQKHMEEWSGADSNRKLNKGRLQETSEDLMASRIREASLSAELTDLKQKMMEIETANHIHERQVKRLEGENSKLTEKQTELETKERELLASISDIERQLSNIESKTKEDEMMSRIREAEHSQSVAEMRQRIAELEIQNQELLTAEQLHDKPDKAADPIYIENRIADLKDEICRLKMLRVSRGSRDSIGMMSYDTDSDDDYELRMKPLRLSVTDSHSIDDALADLTQPQAHSTDDTLNLSLNTQCNNSANNDNTSKRDINNDILESPRDDADDSDSCSTTPLTDVSIETSDDIKKGVIQDAQTTNSSNSQNGETTKRSTTADSSNCGDNQISGHSDTIVVDVYQKGVAPEDEFDETLVNDSVFDDDSQTLGSPYTVPHVNNIDSESVKTPVSLKDPKEELTDSVTVDDSISTASSAMQ